MEVAERGLIKFTWNNIEIRGVSNLIDGRKHIISVTRNAKHQTISLFVDGVKEKSVNDKVADPVASVLKP